jgi:hypothetical protein
VRSEKAIARARAYYLKNKDLVRERSRRFKQSERGHELDRLNKARKRDQFNSTIRVMLNEFKSKPCMDCSGVFDPICMDFDHRPGETKLFDIAAWQKWSARATTAKLLTEIAKCDLVCSNCHRIRTHKRRSHYALIKAGMEKKATATESQLALFVVQNDNNTGGDS